MPDRKGLLPSHVKPRRAWKPLSVSLSLSGGKDTHGTSPRPVKRKQILREVSGDQQDIEYLVYEGVSFDDYVYIRDRLEKDDDCKAWNRLSYFPASQQLNVTMPTAVQDTISSAVLGDLGCMLKTIPAPGRASTFRILRKCYLEGESLLTSPDICVNMRIPGCDGRRLPQTVWLMENAFTESDCHVTDKLRCFVRDIEGLMLVGKIVIEQSGEYRSPRSTEAMELQKLPLLRKADWARGYGTSEGFATVKVDQHTWFSLSSIKVHIWIRKPGQARIDIDCLDTESYAYGTLYPEVSLESVNEAFRRGLELVKQTILVEHHENSAMVDGMQGWAPPTRILDPENLMDALVDGAWDTGYDRYCSWHRKLDKKQKRGRERD